MAETTASADGQLESNHANFGNTQAVNPIAVDSIHGITLEEVMSKGFLPIDGERVLYGRNMAMVLVYETILMLRGQKTTVTITGESGTGKELAARALHKYSGITGEFVALNSAALVPELFESELYGHENGAFTDACADKIGLLESANNGTLFLDEIAELSLAQQAKLLKFLDNGEIRAVGATERKKIDARIIAATGHDLRLLAEDGRFMPELYYRLNIAAINLPPLRERRDDIALLAGHFLTEFNTKYGRRLALSDEKLEELMQRPWRGNIRELRNDIERMAVTSDEEDPARRITYDDICRQTLREGSRLRSIEFRVFVERVRANDYSIVDAAREYGTDNYRLKRLFNAVLDVLRLPFDRFKEIDSRDENAINERIADFMANGASETATTKNRGENARNATGTIDNRINDMLLDCILGRKQIYDRETGKYTTIQKVEQLRLLAVTNLKYKLTDGTEPNRDLWLAYQNIKRQIMADNTIPQYMQAIDQLLAREDVIAHFDGVKASYRQHIALKERIKFNIEDKIKIILDYILGRKQIYDRKTGQYTTIQNAEQLRLISGSNLKHKLADGTEPNRELCQVFRAIGNNKTKNRELSYAQTIDQLLAREEVIAHFGGARATYKHQVAEILINAAAENDATIILDYILGRKQIYDRDTGEYTTIKNVEQLMLLRFANLVHKLKDGTQPNRELWHAYSRIQMNRNNNNGISYAQTIDQLLAREDVAARFGGVKATYGEHVAKKERRNATAENDAMIILDYILGRKQIYDRDTGEYTTIQNAGQLRLLARRNIEFRLADNKMPNRELYKIFKTFSDNKHKHTSSYAQAIDQLLARDDVAARFGGVKATYGEHVKFKSGKKYPDHNTEKKDKAAIILEYLLGRKQIYDNTTGTYRTIKTVDDLVLLSDRIVLFKDNSGKYQNGELGIVKKRLDNKKINYGDFLDELLTREDVVAYFGGVRTSYKEHIRHKRGRISGRVDKTLKNDNAQIMLEYLLGRKEIYDTTTGTYRTIQTVDDLVLLCSANIKDRDSHGKSSNSNRELNRLRLRLVMQRIKYGNFLDQLLARDDVVAYFGGVKASYEEHVKFKHEKKAPKEPKPKKEEDKAVKIATMQQAASSLDIGALLSDIAVIPEIKQERERRKLQFCYSLKLGKPLEVAYEDIRQILLNLYNIGINHALSGSRLNIASGTKKIDDKVHAFVSLGYVGRKPYAAEPLISALANISAKYGNGIVNTSKSSIDHDVRIYLPIKNAA